MQKIGGLLDYADPQRQRRGKLAKSVGRGDDEMVGIGCQKLSGGGRGCTGPLTLVILNLADGLPTVKDPTGLEYAICRNLRVSGTRLDGAKQNLVCLVLVNAIYTD